MEFIDLPALPGLADWHSQQGGKGLRFVAADLGGDWLRAMFGIEPSGAHGNPERHVSVSVSEGQTAEWPAKRPANDAKCSWVLAHLGFVGEAVETEGIAARHFWEPAE